MQVQVLPGVLCPKHKRSMRRDVAPEEAGSSPAGHPSMTTNRDHPVRRRDAPRYAGEPDDRAGRATIAVAVPDRTSYLRLWPNW